MSSNKIIAAALAAEVSSIRVTQTLGIRNGGISPESQSNTEVPSLDVDMTAVMESNNMEHLQLKADFPNVSDDEICKVLNDEFGKNKYQKARAKVEKIHKLKAEFPDARNYQIDNVWLRTFGSYPKAQVWFRTLNKLKEEFPNASNDQIHDKLGLDDYLGTVDYEKAHNRLANLA